MSGWLAAVGWAIPALALFHAPPLPDAEANLWVRAGARSHLSCAAEDEAAARAAARWNERGQELPDAHPWAERARECPNAPVVLRIAAMHELSRRFPVAGEIDRVDLGPVAETITRSRHRARAWLEASLRERARRGQPPIPGTRDQLALCWLGADVPARARDTAREGEAAGEIEPWRAARTLALAQLALGALDDAVAEADRALRHAPASASVGLLYVYALVADRAGESTRALGLLRQANAADRDSAELFGLVALLPLHERLYLLALERQANGDTPSAALALWSAYLQLASGPGPAERVLAERHRDALAPRPGRIE